MIQAQSLRCGYGDTMILRGLDISLREDEFAVLAGPNGAGKSTLLYALLGFLRLDAGRIELFGRELRNYKRSELARLIAFVPQESLFQFDHSVFDIVLMGRYPYLGLMQSWTPQDRAAVGKVLQSLGLEAMAERFYSELSGGEKQRVLIARALAQDTKYIFLDESLSQLDINHQIECMELLRGINRKEGKGILLISHNLNLAANYADKLIFLKDGTGLGTGKPAEMMDPLKLEALFGMRLSTVINPSSGIPNLVYPGPDAR